MGVTLVLVLAAAPDQLFAQTETGETTAGVAYEASGAGPPVVLIHGFSLDRRMWNAQVDLLHNEFRVVRYDLRGHGRSAAPSDPYAAYEDLAAVMDSLGLPRATLVGLSAGAQVATDFALAFPDRVDGLVLTGPGLSGFVPAEPLTWAAPPFQAAAAGDPERAARLWLETPIMATHSGPRVAAKVAEIVSSNARLFSYRSNPDQGLEPPAIDRLSEISCPVLVLVGDRDMPHIRAIANLLATGIDGAQHMTVAGAGHLVNLDAPEPFNRVLLAFLQR